MRSTMVRSDQVRGLLALVHEAREIGAGQAQRRHLVDGVARLVGAEFVTILVDADFGPGGRGNVIEHAANYVDGSILRMFEAYGVHGTSLNPGCSALMARTRGRRTGDRLTHTRRELLRDAEWYESAFVSDYQRPTGLDDFVYSIEVIGRHRVGAVTVTRQVKGRGFADEDANLLDLFHEEYARLTRPTPRVDGPHLPPRGREVLNHLLGGAREKEIADALAISRETVHGYVKAIYTAYGVSSRAELLARCLGPSRAGV